MAAFYPGIPTDFRDWDDELKAIWLEQVDAVIAWQNQRETIVTAPTADGAFMRTMLLTGDEDEASLVRAELIRSDWEREITNGKG